MARKERHRFSLSIVLVMLAGGCLPADSGQDADSSVADVLEVRIEPVWNRPVDAIDMLPEPEDRPPDCTDEHPRNLARLNVSVSGDEWLEPGMMEGRWRGARGEGGGTVVSIEGAAGTLAEIVIDLPVEIFPEIPDSSRIRWALFHGAENATCYTESGLNLIVLDESGGVLLFAVFACVPLYGPMDLGNVSVRREPRPICLWMEYMYCKHYGLNEIVVEAGDTEAAAKPGMTFELSAGPHVYEVSHRHARNRYWGEFGDEPDWIWCMDEEGDAFSFYVIRR